MEEQEKLQFQTQLLELRARTQKLLEEKTANPLPEPKDEAELGSAALDMALELSSKKVLKETLEMIEKALKRLEAGIYDICEICRRKIPLNRLKTIPYTSYCVECQAKIEEEKGK